MNGASGSAAHWDKAYGHGDATRSWYQTEASGSLRMFDRCGVVPTDSVVDVGAGASTLVDALVARLHRDVTVLDISAAGLETARQRLGAACAEQVHWLVTDLLTWRPERTYRVWHDRAVFHFLTTDQTRSQYLRVLHDATATGSVAVFGTFAPDGPQRCSDLPTARYSADELATVLGPQWSPIADDRELHTTPSGAVQPFTSAAFRRAAP